MPPSPELENLIQVRNQLEVLLKGSLLEEASAPHTNKEWRGSIRAILNESLTGEKALHAPEATRVKLWKDIGAIYDYAQEGMRASDLMRLRHSLTSINIEVADALALSKIYVDLGPAVILAYELRSKIRGMLRELE